MSHQKRVMFFSGDPVAYPFNQWVRIVKTRFSNVEEAKREFSSFAEQDPELFDFVEEIWESIIPYTWEECFKEENDVKRRRLFQAVGPVEMFHQVKDKKKVDTFVNEVAVAGGEDPKGHTYHLWKISAKALNIQGLTDLFVIQCWCPSTHSEYIIFVDHTRSYAIKPNAREAVAWTCRTPFRIECVEVIHRQGEVYSFVLKEGYEPNDSNVRLKEPEHLTGDQYWKLIGQQT